LLISTLACSLTGNADPASVLQTLIPAQAQTQVAGETQTPVTSVVTPADTDLAGGGSGATSSACDNPLYPVVVGATWNYSLTGPLSDTFTRSIAALTSDGFTDQDVFTSGAIRTGHWTCESGNLTNLDPGDNLVTAVVQTASSNTGFQTTAMEGVTMPSGITSGTSWTQNFTIEGNQDLNGQQVASKNVTSFSCTATGEESVTVAAGSFTAMRVDCQTNITITITMAGMEIPTSIISTSSAWYAPGVGMVKTDSMLSDGTTSSIELTAFNIP
jgi:hypothetical protein